MNDVLYTALNRLAKWRMVFAGWQLGTRTHDDPECQAVRDHRELSMLSKVEISAAIGLMLKKGLITQAELDAQMAEEANALNRAYEAKFPGFKANNDGMSLDERAHETMKGWRQ